MRARRRPLTLTAATALVLALSTGCAHHDSASGKATPDTAPSQLAQMQKKVNDAESAAAAADRDASSTADR